MATKHFTAKAAALAAAGKLALSAGTASAEESGGKLNTAQAEAPALHLDIVGTPRDIVLPPTFELKEDYDDFEAIPQDGGGKISGEEMGSTDQAMRATSGSKTADQEGAEPDTKIEVFDQDGFIFVSDVKRYMEANKKPKIDFIVSGVKNAAMDVYLVYSSGREDELTAEQGGTRWGAFGNLQAGSMAVDFNRMTIIAGARVQPNEMLPVEQLNAAVQSMGGTAQPSMGSVLGQNRTVVLSIALEDLSTLPDVVYFQALAVPQNSLDFANGQASEADRFVISKPDMDPSDGTDANQGSKAGESGKAAAPTTTDGTTTDGTTSGGK